jgi:putative acetyltransferase
MFLSNQGLVAAITLISDRATVEESTCTILFRPRVAHRSFHGRVIGHVLFSKLKAPMKALGLAPVAVHPSFQRQGIGLALIREGLALAKEEGWTCVFVLGDPAYYGRFGFRAESAKGYNSPYSGDHFMAVPLADVPKTGEILYPEPFKLLDS